MSQQDRINVRVDAEIRDLVPAFLSNRTKDLHAIQGALQRGDFETIRVIGQNMQGFGQGYGFEGIASIGHELEKTAAAEQAPDVGRLHCRLADYLSRLDVGAAAADGGERRENAATPRASQDDAGGVQGDAMPAPCILVVEDEETSRLLVTRCLRDQGYTVKYARNGEEALAMLEQAPMPAVVLLDVIMSGMSGFEVCRKMKTNPATLSIPVVLLTGLDGREDRIRGFEADADEFLSKPVCREELIAKLRSLVRLREARSALAEQQVLREIDKHQRVRRMFERYVSPKVAQVILSKKGEAEALWAKHIRRDAVVLFADLRGFTRMSERLEVDRVAALLNQYIAALTQAAYRYEGTVFNMTGDGLVVGFNVPVMQQDAARRALMSACEMMLSFRGIAQDWQREHGIEVGLGIGINRGEVIAGNIGSPTYMTYTMIGDTVNVAARLTDAARANEIVVAESLAPLARKVLPGIEKEITQPLTVKGKAVPLKVCRIAFERLVNADGQVQTMTPRVLVIDDSEDIRALVAQFITREWPGAPVEGWDPVKRGKPGPGFDWSRYDVVFLDYHLGDEDGLEWLQQFSRDPNCPPVVFFSGVGDENLAVNALRSGAVDYFGKRELSRARIVEAVGAAMTEGSRRHVGSNHPAPESGAANPPPVTAVQVPAAEVFHGDEGDKISEVRIAGYRCIRKLGRGGMSSVYLAQRQRDQLTLVLKLLNRELCDNRDMRLRFIRETSIICKLNSPRVVRLYDHGIAGSHLYSAMEYMAGGDLKERIRGGMTPEQALHYLAELAYALKEIHGAGVLHRDLKPQNIMFRGDDSLALIDFGISKQVGETNPLTLPGKGFGTPSYVSPEQGRGNPADERSDLYSLGVVFYEMLTRKKPFTGNNAAAVIGGHIHEPIPALPDQLANYQNLVDRMLAKQPEARFQSAHQLLSAIERSHGAQIEILNPSLARAIA